jgi:hypothetical protein
VTGSRAARRQPLRQVFGHPARERPSIVPIRRGRFVPRSRNERTVTQVTITSTRLAAFAAVAALIIAGCGSSGNSSSNTSSTQASAAPAATTGAMSGGGQMGAAAPIPADLKCPDAIVWVNTNSKAYHLHGDEYYGRTKHGEYMCRSMADEKGYHLAGMGHGHSSQMMNGGTPAPAST